MCLIIKIDRRKNRNFWENDMPNREEEKKALLEKIPCEKKIAMFSRLLLAWDGQWFLKTVAAVGLDAAIDQNARVRTSFARIEMREFLKELHLKRAKDLEQAILIMGAYSDLFGGNRIQADWEVTDEHSLKIEVRRCPAVEGAMKAGLPRSDQPCIACERLWPTWLSVLLPDVQWTCQIPEAIGRGAKACRILVKGVEQKQIAGE